MSSKELVATCTVCQQRNTFRQLPPSAAGKEDTRLFCNTCNLVTLQKIGSGGNTLQVAQPYGGGSGGPRRSPLESNDVLWQRLERGLTDSGMRITDLFRCDEGTRRMVVERLGFRPEADRLLGLIAERHPQHLIPPTTDAPSPSNVAATAPAPPQAATPSQPAPNSSSNFNSGGRALFQQGAQGGGGGANSASRRPYDDPSPLRGISYINDSIIARCSVHPELPAEFWCCTCNVLVSSRCHVQGVHKDHPFITLRVAAEGHVRDLLSWSERCRSQLGVTESIIANLNHSASLVQQSRTTQLDALDSYVAQITEDLARWKEQLRHDIHAAVDTQVSSIQFASGLAEKMHDTYHSQLQLCDPLMGMVPPAELNDKASEEWSLRVLDFVSKVKLLNVEPIPLPKIFIPEVKCLATPASQMELLKQVSVPLGVRLPDIIDPGYFNFPQPTSSARVPFTLQPPPDSKSKGVLVYSGRTMTRAQDVLPSQTLVTASQVFYSGTTSWEVHIDRLGAGPGRILAGIIIHGSDGEGIVWDGQRIVGPNEGECRVIDDKYLLRPGSVLRFVLELDAPQQYLNCFFDRDGVARIPLPPTGNGWVPAFSVFGPQDQITVVPTSSATRLATAAATTSKKEETVTVQKIKDQEQLIASLQQQLQGLTMRLDAEQFRANVMEANRGQPPSGQSQAGPVGGSNHGSGAASGGYSPPPNQRAQQQQQYQQQYQQAPSMGGRPPPGATTPGRSGSTSTPLQGGTRAGGGSTASTPPPQAAANTAGTSQQGGGGVSAADLAYSPELQSLLRFVEEIR